ncbi:solute carrier family 2, facilitated glucose transporter member 7 [Pogona vitticeps]
MLSRSAAPTLPQASHAQGEKPHTRLLPAVKTQPRCKSLADLLPFQVKCPDSALLPNGRVGPGDVPGFFRRPALWADPVLLSQLIQDFYNVTYHQKKITLNKGFLSFLYNLTTALFSLGGLIGSLLASLLVDRFGRRGALILNNILSMISALLMGFSSIVFASEYTIFTRLLTGICSGVFSCVVPMYLGEVAPKMLRGTVISVSMVFVAVGTLFSQILALHEILGNKKEWPILLSLMGFLALFQVLVLPCLPESPRYLLIQKGNEVKARQGKDIQNS